MYVKKMKKYLIRSGLSGVTKKNSKNAGFPSYLLLKQKQHFCGHTVQYTVRSLRATGNRSPNLKIMAQVSRVLVYIH